MKKTALPIDPLIPQIAEEVQRNAITILQAEPGAGKTTRVPAALLDAFAGQIHVLEPRRLAARLAARRVADERAERVGQTIGYQVRFEQLGGAGDPACQQRDGLGMGTSHRLQHVVGVRDAAGQVVELDRCSTLRIDDRAIPRRRE